MWTCPHCTQQFIKPNQAHSCGEKTEADFLRGKSEHVVQLYYHFLEQCRALGTFTVHPAKSRISLAGKTRFCSINRIGRDFIDFSIVTDGPFPNNLCFHKSGKFPGEKFYQHHCRLYQQDDLNEEVLQCLQVAFERDANLHKPMPASQTE